jgi:hypothetical protein
MGDGTRLEPGRARALRVQLPLLPLTAFGYRPSAIGQTEVAFWPIAEGRQPKAEKLGDRLTVGWQSLKLPVKVRILLPELVGIRDQESGIRDQRRFADS